MAKLDKLYFGTNTKMYKTIAQTVEYVTALAKLTEKLDCAAVNLFVLPSFTALEAARSAAGKIMIGAQNMGWEDEGPFTGEISPRMLKEVGVEIVEIGHSERRSVLGETDAMVNQKIHCTLRHGLIALLCIGETSEEKSLGIADEVLRMQLKRGLYGVVARQAEQVWIAYEPAWAIGATGQPASAEYVEARHWIIRQTLAELFGGAAGAAVPILYGGSVNKGNAAQLMRVPHVCGLFIGRSAWQAEEFYGIICDVLKSKAGKIVERKEI